MNKEKRKNWTKLKRKKVLMLKRTGKFSEWLRIKRVNSLKRSGRLKVKQIILKGNEDAKIIL